jgi:hypothetical protein
MKQPYELRNRLTKIITLKASDLLEHFQWGKQSVTDEEVLKTIKALEESIEELKKSFRE